MANLNLPSGLAPVRYLNGAPWNGAVNMYYIASTDNNAFAVGDPVALSGTGDANGVPGITIGTAGSTCVGVVVGFGTTAQGGPYADPKNLNTTVVPATKSYAYYAAVVDDPNVVFEIQESGAAPSTAADATKNANFVAGTNNGYVSGYTLDNTTFATTSTLNLKLLGLSQRPAGAGATPGYGLYAKWLVLLNNHTYRTGIAGV